MNKFHIAVDLNTKAVEQMINQLSGLSGNLWQIKEKHLKDTCLLYTSPSPRDAHESRMPSSA